MTKAPRFLIAAGSSGSGKTLITCGLLQALQNRGLEVSSFKCGPDYIDPMFHGKVLGKKSHNLDTFFTDKDTTNLLLAKHSDGCDISVIEGVMGYYDGLAGISSDGSAYDVASKTGTPTLLLVNAKGMSVSIVPFIKGFLEYKENSQIQGVLLNQMTAMLYPRMKELIESELGVKCYGYIPKVDDCNLESRHLGLVMPDEIVDIKEKLQKLATVLEGSLDIDGILELANSAADIEAVDVVEEHVEKCCKIGVAKDEAFCFMYDDNLQLLERLGAELVYFSPIWDSEIPNVDALIFHGGYPELYAAKLAENVSMKVSIKAAIASGMPTIAECGGFMYLHESMEDNEAVAHEMVGVIEGSVYKTSKLGRFGYITLTGGKAFGEEIGESPAHEFHYFDSTNCGENFKALKPLSNRNWLCGHATESLLAGFPHFYFYGNPRLAEVFVAKATAYKG